MPKNYRLLWMTDMRLSIEPKTKKKLLIVLPSLVFGVCELVFWTKLGDKQISHWIEV